MCARDPRLPANDPANNCIPDPAPCRPGDINYDPMTQLCDPATVIIRGPYVSIKKYAKEISASGDTQTAPIAVARGEYFNYYYQLQNTGSVAATYVVVKDTLPTYLTFTGPIVIKNSSGTNVSSDWLCTQGSQIFP